MSFKVHGVRGFVNDGADDLLGSAIKVLGDNYNLVEVLITLLSGSSGSRRDESMDMG